MQEAEPVLWLGKRRQGANKGMSQHAVAANACKESTVNVPYVPGGKLSTTAMQELVTPGLPSCVPVFAFVLV